MQLTIPPKIFRDNPSPSMIESNKYLLETSKQLPMTFESIIPSKLELKKVVKRFTSKNNNVEDAHSHQFVIRSKDILEARPKIIQGYYISNNAKFSNSIQQETKIPFVLSSVPHKVLSSAVIHAVRSLASQEHDSLSNDIKKELFELSKCYPLQSVSLYLSKMKVDDLRFAEKEEALNSMNNARSCGAIQALYEKMHFMLNTGARMRREFCGRCVYRGFLSLSIVKSDVYKRRYMSKIKQ